MHVLLTGAAGRIGTAFSQATAERYRFRLADRDISSIQAGPGHETLALDVADLDACRAACAGMNAVVHLAADPSPEADWYPSLLDNNIKGVYNIFQAAKDAGCERVIFASSIHAVIGYSPDHPIGTSVPVNPITLYGASKCFGEAVARYFANAEGLSAIAIRIGAYEAPWIHETPSRLTLSNYVSPRDLNQLIVRALEAPPGLRFAIVNGQSNNRISRCDLTSTRELLGYAPQDDAFELFDETPDSPASR